MSIRFGLIGAGRMGQVLAHHLAYSVAEANFVAVADMDATLAQDTATRFGAEAGYGDNEELLARQDIDAVVIATPTNTHPEVIIAAAQVGKHIFSEKPLALTVEACETAIAAVEAAGVKFQIGFMRRYDPGYVMAKKQIEAGVIGKPVMFKSLGRDPKRTSLEFARREASGGLIADMGVHDFDLARWLMGSEVERVSTEGGCLVYPELEQVGDIDNAVINLKFENGAVGNIDVSRNAVYGYDIRTEILGSEGSLMIGKLRESPLLVMTRAGIRYDTVPYFIQPFDEAYAAEIRDFVRCIVKDLEPSVTGKDGWAATTISIAATLSLDEGRPVYLSELK
ncbi:MAG TPA: inositol 2-dehydrogenase [Anaerolineales bacterium]|nr:inositol 2-dehydrogenase [Anaerolineales bacterium]